MNELPVQKKLTPKREAFSLAIVDNANPTGAYKRAGYSHENMLPATIANNAYKLMQNNDIAARIQELQNAVTAAFTEKRAWDQVRFIDEAEKNLNQSSQLGQMAPANGALQLIGRTAGLLESQPQAPVQITKVTVVLSRRGGSVDTETRQMVDSTSRMLEPSEEE